MKREWESVLQYHLDGDGESMEIVGTPLTACAGFILLVSET